MMIHKHGLTFLLCFSFLFVACEQEQNNSSSTERPSGRTIEFTGQLEFRNANDDVLTRIDIAVANTPESRNLGLMDVHELKSDGGMLFIFDQQDRLSFWMANTPLPLDLIFANTDFEIVHIHSAAQPYTHQSIDSVEPAIYVVEVNSGFAVANDLQVGHKINFTF